MPRVLVALMFLGVIGVAGRAADPPALEKPVIDTHYKGGFSDDFPAELTRVQTLLRLVQLDVSSQLGFIRYNEGFLYPVTVHFEDGAPATSVTPLFYVVPATDGRPYAQELVANVEAFAERQKKGVVDDTELRKAFTYAMTLLILNDLAGGRPEKQLPLWVEEGAAIYLSGAGDELVQKAAQRVTRSHVVELVDELNRPFPILGPRQYARYYLAIKYLAQTAGTSGFQAFMRNVLEERSAAEAVRDVIGQEWEDFEGHVREFSLAAFTPYTQEDPVTGPAVRTNL